MYLFFYSGSAFLVIMCYIYAILPDCSDLERIEYFKEMAQSRNLFKSLTGKILLACSYVLFYVKIFLTECLTIIIFAGIIFIVGFVIYGVFFLPRLYSWDLGGLRYSPWLVKNLIIRWFKGFNEINNIFFGPSTWAAYFIT